MQYPTQKPLAGGDHGPSGSCGPAGGGSPGATPARPRVQACPIRVGDRVLDRRDPTVEGEVRSVLFDGESLLVEWAIGDVRRCDAGEVVRAETCGCGRTYPADRECGCWEPPDALADGE